MSAWKACDIRGLYPREVNPDLMESVAQCIATQMSPRPRVLVAGDFRLSTPELKAAVIAGLLNAGARVLDAGQVATPVAYFAHAQWQTDAVLIVTASHNPPDYNGLKFMVGNLPPTESDLEWLRKHRKDRVRSGYEGTVERLEPLESYCRWIKKRWVGCAQGMHLKVVLDAGSGVWSEVAPLVFQQLGCTVHRIFCEIDGRFPHRSPDCARPMHLTRLCAEVLRTGANLGIAWDGDGDRVAFVDECGHVVSADQISVLLSRSLLLSCPGDKVAYDVKLSDRLRETLLEAGGIPIMERSGHTFLKRRVIQDECLLGCEASGHYFYRELRGGDDGLFTALLMTDLVAREGSLGSLTATVPSMYITPDLRLPSKQLSFDVIAARLRTVLASERISVLDGIRIETFDGFVLARPSVTEPVVSLRMEGFHELGLRRLIGRCVEILPEVASHIWDQMAREDGI